MSRWKSILMSVMVVCVAFALGGCGSVVEQNEVALVLKTLGSRSAETVNTQAPTKKEVSKDASEETGEAPSGKKAEQGLADNFEAELITATRAPVDRAGIVILRFPLGIQSYEFSATPSFESPHDEAITVQAIGGTVKFNLLFHVYIGRHYPDLKERLVKFMKAYQLRQYTGTSDVLAQLMAGRIRNDLFRPFIDKCAGMKVLDIVRKKDEINNYALEELNNNFNQYGLCFSAAGISSSTTLSGDQQSKLNEMVIEDAKYQALEFTRTYVRPLEEQIAKAAQDGQTEAAALVNGAKAKKIEKIAAAEKERRKLFIDLVGEENYVNLETMLLMVNNLKQGKTKISIVPEKSQVFVGSKGIVGAE